MKQDSVRASAIMAMIPDQNLDFLSAQYRTDYKVHKLKGAVLFKLLAYSLLTQRSATLRVLEATFNSYRFQRTAAFNQPVHTRYNSIRDRIATIDSAYFRALFEQCYQRFYHQLHNSSSHILRFDSTMVALSGKLLSLGFATGSKTNKKQIKFTIGFDGLLPKKAKVFTDRSHTSEDVTLPALILEAGACEPDQIAVFDRGLQSRTKLAAIDGEGIKFVCRMKTQLRYKIIADNPVKSSGEEAGEPTASVRIDSDRIVQLYCGPTALSPVSYRLIGGRISANDEPIYFLTNIEAAQMEAASVAAIYRRRWDIEVFFKFLKQELNLSHLMVRTCNGMEVTLYTTLIVSMLILAYRQLNGLKGYKIVKLQFANELEEDLIREVVILCGGNPEKMYQPPPK